MDAKQRDDLVRRMQLYQARLRAEERSQSVEGIMPTFGRSSAQEASDIRARIHGELGRPHSQQLVFASQREVLQQTASIIDRWNVEKVLVGALQDSSDVPLMIVSACELSKNLGPIFKRLGENILIAMQSGSDVVAVEYDHLSTGDVFTITFVGAELREGVHEPVVR
jgi:hypothetical protein